ncbi:hypothetical protein ACTFIZ_002870 [Dictyostelium cf. discoideum]
MNRVQYLFKLRGSRSFCSSTPIAKPNKLFGSLFPTQTPINPMKEQIYSFEAIDNGISSPKGTTFKNSLDQPFIQKVLNKSFLYDENGKIKIEEEERKEEEMTEEIEFDDNFKDSGIELQSERFINNLREQNKLQSLELFKSKKESKEEKEAAYIDFLEKHNSNPNFLSFLIESATSESVFENVKKSLSFEVGESVCIQILDNALAGRTVSTIVSLVPKDNTKIEPQTIYKSLSTFGITLNGLRLKVLNASNLKTISLFGLDKNLSEDFLRDYSSDIFDIKMKDPNFCKIKFSSKVYKPHSIGRDSLQSHSGVAHITFDSHLIAMKAVRSLSKSPIHGWVGLSRYTLTEGTAASELISILERRRHKQMDDIKLMKDIIDLKAKVQELENEVKKHEDKKKKSPSKRKYLTNI